MEKRINKYKKMLLIKELEGHLDKVLITKRKYQLRNGKKTNQKFGIGINLLEEQIIEIIQALLIRYEK